MTSPDFEALAAPALLPPTLLSKDIPAEYAAANVSYGMTLALERTVGGRLWACWVGGGDNEHAYFALGSSDDDGATWTDARVILNPHDPALELARRTIVGNLWTDPLGRLWFFFDQAMTFFDGRAGAWAVRCDDPDADEPVWGKPRRLWHGCSLMKPIVAANGDWLLAVSLWDRGKLWGTFGEAFRELDPLRGVHILASSDQGETWERRGHVYIPHPDFDEPNILQLRDGRIWLTARTMDLGVWESYSPDEGRTWSEPAASVIKNVNSRHFMRRLASGKLLLIKNGPSATESTTEGKPYTGRRELTAFLSEDEGATWIGGLVLDERFPVTYPDGTQDAATGWIYISYDFERETSGQILLARFREEDVLAGKVVSPGSRLKTTIFRPLKAKE